MSNTKQYNREVVFYDIREKRDNARQMTDYDLNRTVRMFRWNHLPKTIPERNLELYFQHDGYVFAKSYEDKPCIYSGGLGGELDYLYRSTLATIANPYQKLSDSFPIAWEVDDDTPEDAAVIGLNDTNMLGTLPLFEKFNSLIAENELTIWLTDIIARMPWLLSAQDDRTQKSAEEFLNNIFEGKLGVVTDSAFLEGIKEHILSNTSHQSLGSLMQLHQYYKALKYNEVGLNMLQNQFKKEAISDSEEQANNDILTPLVDDMRGCRETFSDNFNKFFGDKLGIIDEPISVELNSAWENNNIEQRVMIDAMVNAENSEINSDDSITDNTEETNSEISEETPDENEQVETIIEETINEIKEEVEEILEEVTDEPTEEENKDE